VNAQELKFAEMKANAAARAERLHTNNYGIECVPGNQEKTRLAGGA